MAKLMEQTLKASLKAEYQEMGFKVYQLDDHILALDYRDEAIATFSVTGATVVSINEACEKYLNTGRAW